MHSILGLVEKAYAEGDNAAMAAAFFPVPCGFMGTEDWRACREYIKGISIEEKKSSVYFCLLMALDCLQQGDTEQLHRWQSALVALRDASRDNSEQRQQIDYAIYWLNAQVPQTDNGQLLLTMAILYNGYMDRPIQYGFLSATGGTPSVLRGVKDLSEWGKNYKAVKSIIKPMLPALLDELGRGVCEAAIAELNYERNHINEASIEIAAAISATNPEIYFAGMAQLARINRFDPQAKSPDEILKELAESFDENTPEPLKRNYQAVCARHAMEKGDLETVEQWLNEEDSEPANYTPVKLFRLITKAKAMIAMGHYRDALTLLEQIILSVEQDFRPLDTIECLANSAVACELLGSRELAVEKLEKALQLAKPYGYIRVFADLGEPVQRLLDKIHLEDSHYLQDIKAAAAEFASLIPKKEKPVPGKKIKKENKQPLKEQPVEEINKDLPKLVEKLTHSEQNILELLAAGKSNKEIASEINTKLTTVKFHVKNIFGKLGAKNRTEAVNLAKQYGLV